jgi:hypothetical protein
MDRYHATAGGPPATRKFNPPQRLAYPPGGTTTEQLHFSTGVRRYLPAKWNVQFRMNQT